MNNDKSQLQEQIREHIHEVRQKQRIHAPDFPKSLDWLNTAKPLTMSDLQGKIVLLDFWTYCCINCMHLIPDLKYLEDKYQNEPLVVIGVHSAKFFNEKVKENIRQAILRYEVKHPVVNDHKMEIWQTYGARAWPTLMMIDPEGYLIGAFSGEGNRELLDNYIEVMLEIYGSEGKLNRTSLNLQPEILDTPKEPLSYLGKILADEKNNRLYISDSNHNRIVVTDFEGNIKEIVGSGVIGQKDGSFREASFFHPQGMALYKGDLLVADTENHLIRRVDFNNHTVSTLAGTGEQVRMFNIPGIGQEVALNSPWDLLVMGELVFIAMAGPHQIWIMDMNSLRLEPFAGTGQEARLDGPRTEAAFAQPSGLTSNGKFLYVADSEISCVRSINLETGEVHTVVGGNLFQFGDEDGKGDFVRLQHPLDVACREGIVYLADTYNHKIKRVWPETRECKSWLGTGKPGFHDGTSPEFYEPSGLAFADDRLYIADTNNHKIRVVDLKTDDVSTLDIKGLGGDEHPV